MAIDAHGSLIAELPLKKPGGLQVYLDLPEDPTLFPLLPVFPIGALLFAVVLPWLPRRPNNAEASKTESP
jgi:hypothetical protein